MEEKIAEELRKVSFMEVTIREDMDVRPPEEKPEWLNQRVIVETLSA